MIEPIDFIFFDSGTGGLPYMLYLKKQNPLVRCIYLADTRNFPYGEKSPCEITDAAVTSLQLILKYFAPKGIVISCNTLSIIALKTLRKEFPHISFVGTVPAIKQAGLVSKNRRIGILATNRTVENPYTENLIARFAADCTVIKRGDPDLIYFIEHSFFSASDVQKEDAVRPAIDFFRSYDVDTIVLGCTHFLHIAELVARLTFPDIQIIDSCFGVVNQALRVLKEAEKDAPEQVELKEAFLASGKRLLTQDETFFITGHDNMSDSKFSEARYQLIAHKLGIPYGGVCQ